MRSFAGLLSRLEGGMARTQGSKAEITGPAVRDAARRLFARHGFAAVSMRQIAADALAIAICHAHHSQSSGRLQAALQRAAG